MIKLFAPSEAPLWLRDVLQSIARAIQAAGAMDEHLVSALPPASGPKRWIFVTNEVGGAVPAFNDGTNWRRATDRAIVS